jgi:hypothetical protein
MTAGDGKAGGAGREQLIALRQALLRVHNALLELERRDYEKEHGRVNAGELFRLVVDHEQFDWLHGISEFVVRIDELLDGEVFLGEAEARGFVAMAAKMFTPAETGDALQRKYYAAVQRDAAVVLEHAELAREFAKAERKPEKE